MYQTHRQLWLGLGLCALAFLVGNAAASSVLTFLAGVAGAVGTGEAGLAVIGMVKQEVTDE